MATITTTKRALGDDAINQAVSFGLVQEDAIYDTIAKRIVVTTNYRFSTSTGGQMYGTKTTMLTEHAGLTAGERATLLSLLGKLYNADIDADPLA